MLMVKNLSVSYGTRVALQNYNMEVKQGQITAIIGDNGSGKTTLMYAINGTLVDLKEEIKYQTDEKIDIYGQIDYMENDITCLKTSQRAKLGIILCPERRHTFAESSVEENLRIGGFLANRQQFKQTRELVYDMFPELFKLKGKQAGLLSGGEQQMLAFARALMAQPNLLLMDEPFLGLSAALEDRLAYGIKALNQQKGLTIVITEQYSTALLDISDNIIILSQGIISWEGCPASLIKQKENANIYFGL